MVLALLAAHCILQSTDRVLHLAGSLFGLAFSFQLLSPLPLLSPLLWPALSFNSIFIHCRYPRYYLLVLR
jgi:hypothetical protein